MGKYQRRRLTSQQAKQLDSMSDIVLLNEEENVSKRFGLTITQLVRRAKYEGVVLRRGYNWDEYVSLENDAVGKRWLIFDCSDCGAHVEMLVVKFNIRKQRVPVCHACYAKNYVCTSKWREKNSKSQKIAQNRESVKEKHRKNTKRMWRERYDELRQCNADAVRKRFSDPEYRREFSRKMSALWDNEEYRSKVIMRSQAKTGTYGTITYASLAELAFYLWQESLARMIKNYDLDAISYVDCDGKNRNYYPDFIVENKIIEVKGRYWYDRHRTNIEAKSCAAKLYCQSVQMEYRFVLESDIPIEFRKLAKQTHANSKKDCRTQKVHSTRSAS